MKDHLLLFIVIVLAATVANLLALKIVADQVQAQLNAGALQNPLLKLLAR